MTDSSKDQATQFERRARELFAESVDGIDGATLSRLNQARQRALASATAVPRARRWSTWIPAGALAASCVLAALLLWRMPPEGTGSTAAPVAQAPAAPVDAVELLAAGEDLELAAEADLEFYAWVELASTATNDGNG